jgi:hypothetical protein
MHAAFNLLNAVFQILHYRSGGANSHELLTVAGKISSRAGRISIQKTARQF